MKVLMIGQLPKEIGGNYTTGAANVVFELSKQKVEEVCYYTYATNIKDEKAVHYCEYINQYMGYNYRSFLTLFSDFFFYPIKTFREWKHYRCVDHENPLRYAFYKANITRAINKVDPDIIHVHSIGNVSPTRFALKGRKPILLTCHGVFYRGDKSDIKGHDKYIGNLPLCDYYTGLTEDARFEFTEILGLSQSKFSIIPNGVDTNKYYFSENWRKRIRNENGVSDNTVVFITVASLSKRKGQLSFIQILQKLPDCNWEYWIIGKGPDERAIKEYCNTQNLKDRVKLLGYKNSEELYKYYSAADVYAHASTMEGQALCEIEAFSTGLKILVNEKIKGTISKREIEEGDYLIIDFTKPDFNLIHNWVGVSKEVRKTKMNMDWALVAKEYAALYLRLLN